MDQEKVVTLREVLMVRWNSMTIEGMERANAMSFALGKEHGHKAWFFYVVPQGLPLPDVAVRSHMSKTLDTLLAHCQGLAVVMEGRGLKHAAARSIAASFVLVAGKKLHIFGSMQEAVNSLKIPNGNEIVEVARREGIVTE